MINCLLDINSRLIEGEDIIDHIKDFFATLYAKEDWDRPSLDNLHFHKIGDVNASWLERESMRKK